MSRKWSAEKIARVEAQAERIGELQTFVMKSPLFPTACVVVFFAGVVGVSQLIGSIHL